MPKDPTEFDDALRARPDLIARLRSGDSEALVEILELCGATVESYEVRTDLVPPPREDVVTPSYERAVRNALANRRTRLTATQKAWLDQVAQDNTAGVRCSCRPEHRLHWPSTLRVGTPSEEPILKGRLL